VLIVRNHLPFLFIGLDTEKGSFVLVFVVKNIIKGKTVLIGQELNVIVLFVTKKLYENLTR